RRKRGSSNIVGGKTGNARSAEKNCVTPPLADEPPVGVPRARNRFVSPAKRFLYSPRLNTLSPIAAKAEPCRNLSCPHPASQQQVLFVARDYITGDRFEIVRCTACELIVTQPFPTDWGRFYPTAYYGAAGGNRFPKPVELLQDAL